MAVTRPPLFTHRKLLDDPSGPALRSKSEVGSARPLSLLAGKDKFFSAPGQVPDYDWPNPRGKPYPISLRTHLDPVNLTLLGKDKFFWAAGQGPSYDWPLPPRSKPRLGDYTWIESLLQSTLAPSAQAPFNKTDWPNPCALTSRQDFLSTNDLLQTTLARPFTSPWWPNPSRLIQLAVSAPSLDLLLTTLAATPFAKQPDANPPTASFSTGFRTWTQNLLGSTLAPVGLPFAFSAWTVPLYAKQRQQPQQRVFSPIYSLPIPVELFEGIIAETATGQATRYRLAGKATRYAIEGRSGEKGATGVAQTGHPSGTADHKSITGRASSPKTV